MAWCWSGSWLFRSFQLVRPCVNPARLLRRSRLISLPAAAVVVVVVIVAAAAAAVVIVPEVAAATVVEVSTVVEVVAPEPVSAMPVVVG